MIHFSASVSVFRKALNSVQVIRSQREYVVSFQANAQEVQKTSMKSAQASYLKVLCSSYAQEILDVVPASNFKQAVVFYQSAEVKIM